jgi:hypothetical protein
VNQLQQELAERMQQLGQAAATLRVGGGITRTATAGSSGIIGVASNSDQASIKVYNEREKYNEWEFIAPLQAPRNPPGNANDPPPPPAKGLEPKKN